MFLYDHGTDDRAVGKDRTATRYELERHIPIDAESIVFDSWLTSNTELASQTKRVAAIAVDQSRLKSLIDSLEDLSVDLVAIVPTVSLISSGLMTESVRGHSFAFLITEADSTDYVERRKEGIVRWSHWNEDASTLGKQISLVESEPETDEVLWVCGWTEEEFEASELHSKSSIGLVRRRDRFLRQARRPPDPGRTMGERTQFAS